MLPFLYLAFFVFVLITLVVFFVDPQKSIVLFGFPISPIILFFSLLFAFWFFLSTFLSLNTQRGLLISAFITSVFFFSFLGILTFLNILILLLILILVNRLFSFKNRRDLLKYQSGELKLPQNEQK